MQTKVQSLPFQSTISWLISFARQKGYSDLAEVIQDNWCWEDLGEKYQEGFFPQEFVEKVVQAIIASKDAEACYNYCKDVENREDLVQAIINSEDGYASCWYCQYVVNQGDVVQALIASKNGKACYWYCKNVENREDVIQALIVSKDGLACYDYCRYVQNREDVANIAKEVGYVL